MYYTQGVDNKYKKLIQTILFIIILTKLILIYDLNWISKNNYKESTSLSTLQVERKGSFETYEADITTRGEFISRSLSYVFFKLLLFSGNHIFQSHIFFQLQIQIEVKYFNYLFFFTYQIKYRFRLIMQLIVNQRKIRKK